MSSARSPGAWQTRRSMKNHLGFVGLVAFQLIACGAEGPGEQAETAVPEEGGAGEDGSGGAAAGGEADIGDSGGASEGGAADIPEQPMAGAGGTDLAGGGAGGDPSAEPGPAMLGPDGYPAECVQAPALPEDATGRTDVTLSLGLGDAPFVFGEENTLPSGGTVLPTNFRFYLSQFELIQAETSVPAAPVSPAGAVLPYGVQLVNAEDAASLEFQLAAPPGEYEGITFLVGLTEGCNSSFSPLAPPLDEASQMKWPHVLGFLFLRFEGVVSMDAAEATPDMIHMGSASPTEGFAPLLRLEMPVSVAEAAVPLALHVDFSAILEAASMETDLSDYKPLLPAAGEEIVNGERLRRNVSLVQIFSGQ